MRANPTDMGSADDHTQTGDEEEEEGEGGQGGGGGRPRKNRRMKKNTVKSMVGLSGRDYDLVEQESAPTSRGTRKVRVAQSYKNLPIWGASVTYEVFQDGSPSGAAEGHILADLRGEIDMGDNIISGENAFGLLRDVYHPNVDASLITKKEMVECIANVPESTGESKRVWRVMYYVWPEGGDASQPQALIDAFNGTIYKSWDSINHLNIPNAVAGNLKSHVGLRRLSMDVFDAGNNVCYYYSEDVEVQDLEQGSENQPFVTRGFPCHAPNDSVEFDVINGGYSPLNEVFIYSQNVHDCFVAWAGRPPLGSTDAQGNVENRVKIYGRAHVRNCYDNAFWNGEAIHIGDGCGTFYPLSSIDVVAHEIAHGYTTYTSGLVYSAESGGMNEAFSDMAGEAVEAFVLSQIGQVNDWLIGSDIYKREGGSLRYMEDPTRDGRSIGHFSQYTSGMDVHYSSGVYNRAFYLLSNSPGWNIEKAFRLFARANWVEWEARSTMHCGACGVQNAAADLGAGYEYVPHVQAAFEEVGVDCGNCS